MEYGRDDDAGGSGSEGDAVADGSQGSEQNGVESPRGGSHQLSFGLSGDEEASEEEEVGDWDDGDDLCGLEDFGNDDDRQQSGGSECASNREESDGVGEMDVDGEGAEESKGVIAEHPPNDVGVAGGGIFSGDQACASTPDSVEQRLHLTKCDTRWLENLHRSVGTRLGAKIIEGGEGKVKFPQFANRSQEYRPFRNITVLLLWVMGVKHQMSRAAMTDLFDILRYVDGEPGDGAGEGRGFDVKDVPENGSHFLERMREYLPLFEVWERNVRSKKNNKNPGAPDTVKVYDIPISQVLAFLLRSTSSMEEMLANPGGVVIGDEEAQNLGLPSEHLLAVPTRPVDNRRRNVMHGTLVRDMPHLNTDGFLSAASTRLYVGDVAMCDLRAKDEDDAYQVPCRILRTFIDQGPRTLEVVVRRFRNANEVLGLQHGDPEFKTEEGLVRVWEEIGTRSEVALREAKQALDLIEVFTKREVEDGAHTREWIGEGERREGWSFFGEGFVKRVGMSFQTKRDKRGQGWRRAGNDEENYPNMRATGVNHNTLNLKHANLPIGIWVDDFNVWNMNNPVSALVAV